MTGIILIAAPLFCYILLLLFITRGWNRIPLQGEIPLGLTTTVSVVIAARNEESNISSVIGDLLIQDYPPGLLEIIVVDDHSGDRTFRIAEGIIQSGTGLLKYMKAPTGQVGKKAALHQGILAAKGKLIVTTDADCRFGKKWVSSIVAYYEQARPVMILGPVQFKSGNSLPLKFQELEFISLMSVTAGSAGMGIPLLANGANLAYEKEAYLECGGFEDNLSIPSGDDVFMMLAFRKKYGRSAVGFLKSPEAIVQTEAPKTLKSFLNQRLRWVSKSRGYMDFLLVSASMLVFLTNLILFLLWVCLPFSSNCLRLSIAFLIIKTLADLPIMIGVSRFFRRSQLLWLLPILEIMNAAYTVIIGVLGNLLPYTWKGRRNSPILKTGKGLNH